jgi:hypothetical protein
MQHAWSKEFNEVAKLWKVSGRGGKPGGGEEGLCQRLELDLARATREVVQPGLCLVADRPTAAQQARYIRRLAAIDVERLGKAAGVGAGRPTPLAHAEGLKILPVSWQW